MTAAEGEIPQSSALAEADPFSLSELMSRDPEGYKRQDRDRIIQALRENRARCEAAEKAASCGEGKRGPRAMKITDGPVTPIDINKLGL